AEIMLMKGDVQGASAQADELLKKDQHDRQALLLRARVRAANGQPDGLKAAIEDLNEVLKQEPNSRAGLYFMAQANFALGNIEQARTSALDLERNYPDYLPAKLMKVQIGLAAGDPKSTVTLAGDLIDRLNKTAPDRETSPQLLSEIKAKTYLARGTAYLQLRDAANARKDFEASRETWPNNPEIYNNLALLSLNENKKEEAIGLFENALKIDANNFNALNGILTLYTSTNEFDKAHARVDAALSANPNRAPLHYLKAQIYGFQQDATGAERELRKAIELDPNYLAAYSALGALFINSKQEDRAIAEYKKILQISPDSASAYTIIGMLEDGR